VVNQREVGPDTASLHVALKNALRQAPDVILIGEIRDQETMCAALSYAQSGHLCADHARQQQLPGAEPNLAVLYPVEVRPTMLGDLATAAAGRSSRNACCARHRACGTPAAEVLLNTKLRGRARLKKATFRAVREAHGAVHGRGLADLRSPTSPA